MIRDDLASDRRNDFDLRRVVFNRRRQWRGGVGVTIGGVMICGGPGGVTIFGTTVAVGVGTTAGTTLGVGLGSSPRATDEQRSNVAAEHEREQE